MPESQLLSLISADEYASRSAMLYSLVVSWSPLLHVASEFYPNPNKNASVSLLAVGGKSGKISLWRFHQPDCYTIEDRKAPAVVKFIGLLHAHNSWITTMSWLLFAFDSLNPQIILVTGSSDGRWVGYAYEIVLYSNLFYFATLPKHTLRVVLHDLLFLL